MLEVNQTAPGFTAVDQDGESVSLAQFKGDKHVVLYFYPKDDTPGCTTEANEFTALIDEFAAADTVVLGVSKDSCQKHQKFIAKHGLKVRLLADTEGSLCELYGTWGPRKFMGREYMGIGRSTAQDTRALGHATLHLDRLVGVRMHACDGRQIGWQSWRSCRAWCSEVPQHPHASSVPEITARREIPAG